MVRELVSWIVLAIIMIVMVFGPDFYVWRQKKNKKCDGDNHD